jgi:hypothetical protein
VDAKFAQVAILSLLILEYLAKKTEIKLFLLKLLCRKLLKESNSALNAGS